MAELVEAADGFFEDVQEFPRGVVINKDLLSGITRAVRWWTTPRESIRKGLVIASIIYHR